MRADLPTSLTTGPAAVSGRRNVGWLATGLGLYGLLVGMLVVPPDAGQGDAQRLMYLHVPAAWTAYLCFAVVPAASAGYLVWGDLRWDRATQAAAEIGVGLTALAIALGAVWGRAEWGVWWTWDPRLVGTTLLLIIYLGYLCPRAGSGLRRRHAGRGRLHAGAARYLPHPVRAVPAAATRPDGG